MAAMVAAASECEMCEIPPIPDDQADLKKGKGGRRLLVKSQARSINSQTCVPFF